MYRAQDVAEALMASDCGDIADTGDVRLWLYELMRHGVNPFQYLCDVTTTDNGDGTVTHTFTPKSGRWLLSA